MKRVLFWILIPVIVIPLVWGLIFKLETKPPVIDVQLPSAFLQKGYELNLTVSDKKSPLRKVLVSVMQQGKEVILLDQTYSSDSFLGLLPRPDEKERSFVIPVDVRSAGMKDGSAVIRIMASDHSWQSWNKGNIAYVEHQVMIDSVPPKVTVLSRSHNIKRGGSGLVIYRVFEKKLKTGVMVGDNFFPGHSGLFEDPEIHAAFFALNHLQKPGTSIFLKIEDPAGNVTRKNFHHYIGDTRFNRDVLNIPDSFLKKKIPGFDIGAEESRFSGQTDALLKKFLYINQTVRENNSGLILSVPAVTENKLYWENRFLRLSGAAKRAGFGDRRVYRHKGKEIDRQVHLGIDLASTENDDVTAANTGRVIFTDFVGIFGNTVIIDHGFGLCSLYSHLDRIDVEKGTMVNKGDVIGITGFTGLAGGDHLHFSMIVHNVFVNPMEWWDDSWIRNNITSKIEDVKASQSSGI